MDPDLSSPADEVQVFSIVLGIEHHAVVLLQIGGLRRKGSNCRLPEHTNFGPNVPDEDIDCRRDAAVPSGAFFSNICRKSSTFCK